MLRVISCLVLVAFAVPATACINDVELSTHEREFRSQYHNAPASPPAPVASPEPAGRPSAGLLTGTGAVLLTAASALVLVGRRARS